MAVDGHFVASDFRLGSVLDEVVLSFDGQAVGEDHFNATSDLTSAFLGESRAESHSLEMAPLSCVHRHVFFFFIAFFDVLLSNRGAVEHVVFIVSRLYADVALHALDFTFTSESWNVLNFCLVLSDL